MSAAVADINAEALFAELSKRWTLHARPEQLLPPGDWNIWLILSGRGWGKTRTGAEVVRHWVESGKCRRIHLVAATAADARDTMVEGPAGILAVSHPAFMPTYEPSKRRLTWPNGATAHLFSAEEPERLRGPQCDGAWADELAAWKRMQETWDNLQMGVRLGTRPRQVVTTTPRPLDLIKSLVKRFDVVVARGKTMENAANLAPSFLSSMLDLYGGTRLGRQELDGEILDDNPLALWKRANIDATRVAALPEGVSLIRVVVGLDPTCTADGDDAGIVAAGKGSDGEYYVLDDSTISGTPLQWATAAIAAYNRHRADRIVYETNQGGDMVAHTLQSVQRNIPLRGVTASRGKAVRAEPIAALYEQGRVHHVGFFRQLEDELCEWEPGSSTSPNRLDALVWALTDLSRKPEVKQVKFYG